MKWKIKNVWNHQPDPCFGLILQLVCWFSTTSSICCWFQSTASQLGSTSIICYQGRTYQKTQDQVLFCNFRLTPCFSPPILSTVPSSKDVMKGDISSISCRICCWTCHTGGMPRVCSCWGPKQRGYCGSLLGKADYWSSTKIRNACKWSCNSGVIFRLSEHELTAPMNTLTHTNVEIYIYIYIHHVYVYCMYILSVYCMYILSVYCIWCNMYII